MTWTPTPPEALTPNVVVPHGLRRDIPDYSHHIPGCCPDRHTASLALDVAVICDDYLNDDEASYDDLDDEGGGYLYAVLATWVANNGGVTAWQHRKGMRDAEVARIAALIPTDAAELIAWRTLPVFVGLSGYDCLERDNADVLAAHPGFSITPAVVELMTAYVHQLADVVMTTDWTTTHPVDLADLTVPITPIVCTHPGYTTVCAPDPADEFAYPIWEHARQVVGPFDLVTALNNRKDHS